MELSHWNKKEQAPLVEFLGASLLSHPLMMYYCPDRDKREKFITRYMEHNLPRWIQTGTVLVSDPAHAVGVLLPKDAPEYRSPSKGALSMLSGDRSRRIQSHRNVTRNIVGVMIPREKPVQVLTLFGNAAAQKQELLQLVSEAQDLADEKQFVLVYDTFSRRLVDALENQGFSTGYQRNFLDTHFIQTLMTSKVEEKRFFIDNLRGVWYSVSKRKQKRKGRQVYEQIRKSGADQHVHDL